MNCRVLRMLPGVLNAQLILYCSVLFYQMPDRTISKVIIYGQLREKLSVSNYLSAGNAIHQMVINHAGGLHMRITNGSAKEFESPFFHIGTDFI